MKTIDEFIDPATGLLCAMGSHVGYVRLPAGHPWQNEDQDDLCFVDAHGGITYSDIDIDGRYWIGFDYRHGGDPEEIDPAVIRAECAKLAAQVAAKGAA